MPESTRATVVFVGHAALARGVLDAVEMIMGPQEDVHAVGMTPEQDPGAVVEAVQGHAGEDGELLVLADLFGGSPANAVATELLRRDGVELVTGLNLPMALEVLSSVDTSAADMAATAAAAGPAGVIDVRSRLRDAGSGS